MNVHLSVPVVKEDESSKNYIKYLRNTRRRDVDL